MWSTRFEDAAEPLFPMQDRVCSQIAARLSHAIRSTEVERIRRQPAENLTVYQLCLRAAAFSRSGQHGNSAALRLLRQALARDGELGVAHALAARCYHVQRLMGWVSPDDRRLEEGIHHANAAVDLSCSDPEVLWMAGLAIMNISGDIPRGRSLIDQSLRMNPTSTNAWIASCFLHVHAGDGDTATKHFGEAERLNPFDMSHHVQQNAAATSYFVAEDFEAAYAASNACLAQRPGYTAGLRIKVASASLTGRVEEAQQAARELLALEPGASIARMRDYWKGLAPNAPQALDAKLYGWRRAGMPE